MNILVLSWRDPKHPNAGGAEQVMHQHMMGWAEAGHKVTLFTSRYVNSKPNDQIDLIEVKRGGYHYFLGVQLAAFLYYLNFGWKKYDLVVDQFHGMPFFTPLFVRGPKLAVVQETAQEVWLLNPLPKPLNWLVGWLGYFLEPVVFKFYKGVKFMTGSRSAKDDVARMGINSKNIVVVPHGVMLDIPKTVAKKSAVPTISFLGVLSSDKGIYDALEVFRILSADLSYQFWLIGRPENAKEQAKIEKYINHYGLVKRVKFWGFVSQRQKFELLSKSHVLINPSVKEGWGLVNIEANSVGVPVVAYKSAGLIDSVKNGLSGLLVDSKNPESLAMAVSQLLKNKSKYQLLSRGSVEWSRHFSWDNSKALSLNYINQIGDQK